MLAFACRKKTSSGRAVKGHAVALQMLALYPATCCKCYGRSAPLPSRHAPSPASTPEQACRTVAEQKTSWGHSAHCSRRAGRSPKAHPAGSLPPQRFSTTTCSTLLIGLNISPKAAAAMENSANPVWKGARVFASHLAFCSSRIYIISLDSLEHNFQ